METLNKQLKVIIKEAKDIQNETESILVKQRKLEQLAQAFKVQFRLISLLTIVNISQLKHTGYILLIFEVTNKSSSNKVHFKQKYIHLKIK